jgi:RNA polymerase sigma-70 factor (ECF subfamily)
LQDRAVRIALVASSSRAMHLDEGAFTAFYQRTRRPLWAYVYRVSGDAADADDIVSEAYCRLLQTTDRELSDDALRAYLFRIAGNLLTDRWRRSARHRADVAPDPPHASEPQFDDVVPRTFGRLKPRERALLWLAYVEEENHEEIAASLGVKRGSVKVLLSRARARLRDLLREAGLTRG